jgi:rubrerythrin
MKTFRCRICGETYLGYEKPTNCPYCGAHEEFLVPGADWKDEFNVEDMTDISKANLEKTLGFEVSNAAFYLSASAKAKSQNLELEGMFKRLSKIEAEHASTVKKFLKLDSVPEAFEEASDSILENLKAAASREQRAMDHYRQFAKEATEPRLKEFWIELVAIEGDHFEIDTEEQSNFS